jgi:hypothetical protein
MNVFLTSLVAAVTYVSPIRERPIEAFDVEATLRAIRIVENSNSVGAAGERGSIQFKAATWRAFSTWPHRTCECRTPREAKETRRVERQYITELSRECLVLGMDITPRNLALLHNAGYPTVSSGAIPRAKRDFSERVENVYLSLTRTPNLWAY